LGLLARRIPAKGNACCPMAGAKRNQTRRDEKENKKRKTKGLLVSPSFFFLFV
jgi:hypothetical protein